MSISLFNKINSGEALKKAKQLGPEKTIEEIKISGIKGRGGAGFPTGLKWDFTRNNPGEKIVVCNADEGEVGTFKDRELLKNYAETLFEGISIACFAVGAKEAVIYLRSEYPFLADELTNKLIAFNESSDITINLRKGAGAYVCGEETALLDSLEGRRGEPRNKPPFPVETGYLNRPTVINNVETLCAIPHIILNGAAAFAAIGTKESKGPKLFSISGDVANPGVYEFPFGITVDELLRKTGTDPQEIKAVLVGGASGIMVSQEEFSRKICFEDLATGGAVIVFNKFRYMNNIVENILEFFVEESCGQCVPCREGCNQLLKFVRQFKKDKNVTEKEFIRFQELAETMRLASKCGLGQSAVNVYSSVMDRFQKEMISIN